MILQNLVISDNNPLPTDDGNRNVHGSENARTVEEFLVEAGLTEHRF
jgi:hypothetical protein